MCVPAHPRKHAHSLRGAPISNADIAARQASRGPFSNTLLFSPKLTHDSRFDNARQQPAARDSLAAARGRRARALLQATTCSRSARKSSMGGDYHGQPLAPPAPPIMSVNRTSPAFRASRVLRAIDRSPDSPRTLEWLTPRSWVRGGSLERGHPCRRVVFKIDCWRLPAKGCFA